MAQGWVLARTKRATINGAKNHAPTKRRSLSPNAKCLKAPINDGDTPADTMRQKTIRISNARFPPCFYTYQNSAM